MAQMKKRFIRFISIMTALTLLVVVVEPVRATTISDLQKQKEENEKKLNNINGQISDYKGAQADLNDEIEELDAEMVSLLTDINLIEEAIADKEEEIAQTQVDYDAAVATKDEQYESMKVRIKFMYEKGDVSYLQLFTESLNISDMLNKTHYVEELYEYDRNLLEEYQATVEQVAALQDKLEEEKSELQTSKYELVEEQTYVEEVLADKKQEYENYAVVLAKVKQEAAAYTTKIKQETAQIRKLEEEERKRKEEEERKRKEEEERKKAEQEALLAAQNSESQENSGDSDNQSASTESNSGSSGSQSAPAPSNSGGSSKGQQIANYACQFIGNPYVAGGTSLTDGADCSGFVMSVYQAFGYSLPRSSYAQSGVGTAVSYTEAQPGDIIYYGGHVGIYIGNGQIVHASTERTGIKITSATYRSIITVRRVV
ncbi:MAG: NlpC/P60 family protein [Lachnospiraceae bacterium]|nr:NlpC/P60 family protein [Lachnospiraceae bacterium]